MKKLFLMATIILFGVASVISQSYFVTVEWDNDECECQDQGESYYSVKVVIIDEANNVTVVPGTEVRVDFGTYTVDVDVPEVNTHCATTLAPSYKVYAGVSVICDYYDPPEAVCTTGDGSVSGKTCTNFANDDVEVTGLVFN